MLTITKQDFKDKAIKLPTGYEWIVLDDYDKLSIFLASEYISNSHASLLYTPNMLEWMLTVPNTIPEWHIGITVNGSLVGCITGIPKKLLVDGKTCLTAEVNLLAVDRRLRDKNLSTILIYELTRRIGSSSYTSAIYTTSSDINMDERLNGLYKIGTNDSHLSQMKCCHLSFVQYYNRKTGKFKSLPTMREMKASDIPDVIKLTTKTRLYHDWDVATASHYLLPRKDLLLSYVLLESNTIIGYITCYILPSVIKESKSLMPLAYLYHHSDQQLLPMMKYLINDLFNRNIKGIICSNTGSNEEFLNTLSFQIGNGGLNYYTWNNDIRNIKPKDIQVITI